MNTKAAINVIKPKVFSAPPPSAKDKAAKIKVETAT